MPHPAILVSGRISPLLILLGSLLPTLCSSCGDTGPKLEGQVEESTGTVEIRRTSSQAWKHLDSSTTVEFGDSIRCGANAKVRIGLGDGGAFTVDENSCATIASVVDSDAVRAVEISVVDGTVLCRVDEMPAGHARYRVTTPTSTASVKGTYFCVSYSAQLRVSHVNVFAGLVWVVNPLVSPEIVVVGPGLFSVVAWGVLPRPPVKMNYGQWKKVHHLLPPGHYRKLGGPQHIGPPPGHAPFKGKGKMIHQSGKKPFPGMSKNTGDQGPRQGKAGGEQKGRKGGSKGKH